MVDGDKVFLGFDECFGFRLFVFDKDTNMLDSPFCYFLLFLHSLTQISPATEFTDFLGRSSFSHSFCN